MASARSRSESGVVVVMMVTPSRGVGGRRRRV
jgi:hypothetical protein